MTQNQNGKQLQIHHKSTSAHKNNKQFFSQRINILPLIFHGKFNNFYHDQHICTSHWCKNKSIQLSDQAWILIITLKFSQTFLVSCKLTQWLSIKIILHHSTMVDKAMQYNTTLLLSNNLPLGDMRANYWSFSWINTLLLKILCTFYLQHKINSWIIEITNISLYRYNSKCYFCCIMRLIIQLYLAQSAYHCMWNNEHTWQDRKKKKKTIWSIILLSTNGFLISVFTQHMTRQVIYSDNLFSLELMELCLA